MEEWKEYKLGEVCKSIADGDHMPPPKVNSGIPFVTISNIVDCRLDFSNTYYVPQEYYDSLDVKRKPQQGDTIYSVVGTFGKPVYIKDNKPFVFQRHIAILRPDESKIDPQFLFYTLLSPQFYRKADVMAIGAVQRTISLTSLRNATIQVPPIDIQKGVVDALRFIDDKIEVNRRINDNLEQQAQALFKSWFVDFEPFKDGEFVESELGRIPKGWRVKLFKDICENITDGVHDSVKDDKNGNFYLLSCKNIKGGLVTIGDHERKINKETFEKLRNRTKMQKGDILLSSVGTIGEMILLNEFPSNYEFQRSVAIIKPNKKLISSHFLYYAMKAQKDEIIHSAHGAVQQCLFISDIASFKTIYPSCEIMQHFTNVAYRLHEMITRNQQESRRLATLRDTLLPRLMSGELKVNDIVNAS